MLENNNVLCFIRYKKSKFLFYKSDIRLRLQTGKRGLIFRVMELIFELFSLRIKIK